MTADPGSLGVLDAIQALDADPDAADHVAAWLGALDRPQREALRPQLQRIASAVQTLTRLLDEIRAREAAGEAAGDAADRARGAPVPWFEALARGLAAGDVAALRALAAAGPDVAPEVAAVIATGVGAWLDETRPTREGELLHWWAQLRSAPGWPSAADAAARDYEAPLIAAAHEARLYAAAGLDWLADDATARVERLGPRTLWAQLARAVRDLDRADPDDAESGYQSAAIRWPSSPESYAGLAAIAESRGFWTDAYGYYEHLARLCVGSVERSERGGGDPRGITRLRAALFWVRSTRRASADATGGLLALANHPQLQDGDRAVRRRVLELAIAGDCPPGAPWRVDAQVALGELLARDAVPAAGSAFAEVAASYRAARDYGKAAQFSRRAIEAGKQDAAAYWTLADDLRLGEPPDPRRIDEAIAAWQKGFAIEQPAWATSWALLARAMLGDAYRGPARMEELAAALWFGEWAVVIASESALYWSFLARFYRTLNAETTALALVRRALELDPASTAVRDEHAVTLTSLGRWREAREALGGLEAAARTEAERRWIRSLQGYVLTGLGDDQAALEQLRHGCEPWVAAVAAQVMRRLGDRAGADQRLREVWDDATQPGLLRASISIWIGQAGAGESLLAQSPPELTDDPHDVAVTKTWLRAAQGDWDGAERWFQDALAAIRNPRQATMLAAELRDVVALLGDGRADSAAAQRGAAWQHQLGERARRVEAGPGDAAAERARVARLLAGSRYSGFPALTALREAAEGGDRAAIAAAAGQLRKAAPALCDAVIAGVAAAWSTRADWLVARDDAAAAGELYARAAALADSPALQVRRAWAAAVVPPIEPGVPAAAPVIAADPGPALGALIAQVSNRRAWLAAAAFARAAQDSGGDAWTRLAARASEQAPRRFTTRGTPNLPPPIALELPAGPADRERSVTAALPAVRAEVASAVGFELPLPHVHRGGSPDRYRIAVDGLVIEAGPVAADEAAVAQLARAVRDVAWDQLARWIDADRASQAIATWADAAGPVAGSAEWPEVARALPQLLAVMQAAARDRIPARSIGQAIASHDRAAATSVYELIRRARELCRDWLRERVLAGRSATMLPRALEGKLFAALDRDRLDRGAVALGADGRALAGEIRAAAAQRARAIVVTRDPRARFAVASVLAATPGFVPVVSLEEQLV